MRDLSSWSLNLHRWWGVQVRLHASLLMFGVVTLYLAARTEGVGLEYGFLGLAILLLSVLAHEIGHCAAAFRLGGHCEHMVLCPVGGLTQPQVAHDPREELVAAAAGPTVNFVLWLMTGPLVVMVGGSLLGLLSPLHPQGLFEGGHWAVGVKLLFWINGLLVLVNFAPAFPLDGLRIFRSLAWLMLDYQRAVLYIARAAQGLGIGLCVVAWLGHDLADPAWVPLALMALFLGFSAKQELSRLEEQNLDDDMFNYDFSQGYTSLERHYDGPKRKPGKLRSWIERRRDERRQRQADLERDEERQVDEILARLHEKGLDGLTAKERALLNRVSARFRNRQGS
jgi:Zn-dependent protease